MKRAALFVLAAIAFLSAPSRAQTRKPPRRPPPVLGAPPDPKVPSTREALDLKSRFGVAIAEKWLADADPEARLRGIRRLGAVGTPQAIDALVRSQEAGRITSRDVRARLEAVRALAAHATEEGPRQVLYRAIQEATQSQASEEPELLPLLRDTAAIALARGGDDTAIAQLAALVRQGGPVGDAAENALLAYPPRNVDALVGERAPLAARTARLFAAMGDVRGIPYLRRCVREGDAETRVAALVALADLGDAEAALVARAWAKVDDPLAKTAAARALARVSPGEVASIVASLLGSAETREEGLAVALEGPTTASVAELSSIAKDPAVSHRLRASAVAAIGKIRGAAAAQALAGLIETSDVAAEAGLALARAEGDDAGRALERLLTSGKARADVIRAAAARALFTGDAPSGLERAATAALGGSAPEKGAAAFALVAIRAREADDPAFLRDDDLAVGAARAAIVRGAEKLLPSLANANDALHRDAFGVALVAVPDGGSLSTAALHDLVEHGGAVLPLAARALAMRDEEASRSRITELSRSSDPVLRSAIACGLGSSPNEDASGRLAAMYAFEPDAETRRAIVRALARRTSPLRDRVLDLARTLDPDAETRGIARAAIAGAAISELAGKDVAWVVASGASSRVSLRFVRPDGVVVPVVADADGAALVPGLPGRASRVTVSSPP